jgi:hypothetical protein
MEKPNGRGWTETITPDDIEAVMKVGWLPLPFGSQP